VCSLPLARLRVPIAVVVVWLTFGSVYIAIRVGVHHAPPLLFSSVRFVIAGVILLAWHAWRHGGLRLTRRELGEGVAIGALMVLSGQGAVSLMSTQLTPGIVAVLTSTVPLWAAALGRVVFGVRVSALAWVGVGLGFVGVVLLAAPTGAGAGIAVPALIVTGGAAAWALGSLVAGRSQVGRRPLVLTGLQLTSGGIMQLVVGCATGELGRLDPSALVPGPALAFVYLLVVSSLIGFPLFSWLAASVDAGLANSQAYVAPVVALLLGWLVLGEGVTPRALIAAGISLAGVALMAVAAARQSRAADRELREAA
jgi:drug/metabolite transporter (DMT)-like permease